MLSYRPRWSLTVRGWLALSCGLVILVAGAAVCLRNIHSFLAANHPLRADILVVEGWIPDRAFKEVIVEIDRARYKTVFTTGGPVTWTSAPRFGGTYAGYSAERLQRAGIATNRIVAVRDDSPDWQRTYRSALALRRHFEDAHISLPVSLNVITSGPHARRTRLLYERALGNNISVGIVSIPRDDYDPDHWWRTSTGLREVISELAAYLYCRIVPSAFTD
jgi:hypothetical protein